MRIIKESNHHCSDCMRRRRRQILCLNRTVGLCSHAALPHSPRFGIQNCDREKHKKPMHRCRERDGEEKIPGAIGERRGAWMLYPIQIRE